MAVVLLTPIAARASSELFDNDLDQILKMAESNNALYAAARETLKSAQQAVPTARSALLPHLQLSGKEEKGTLAVTESAPRDFYENGYTVSLSQQIFNVYDWEQLSEAKLTVLLASIRLEDARLALVVDTVSAYIGVLKAQETLRSASAHAAALIEQLSSTRRSKALGTASIVEEEEAEARYADACAGKALAENAISDEMAKLSHLLGNVPVVIKPLSSAGVPEINTPLPVEEWLSLTTRNNLKIASSKVELAVAAEHISEAKSAYYPTVELVANHSSGSSSYIESQISISASNRPGRTSSIGIEVTIPIFSGFETLSKQRAMLAERDAAEDRVTDAEQSARELTIRTYLKLTSDLSRITALEVATRSAIVTRDAMRRGYGLGLKLKADLLSAEDYLAEVQTESTKLKLDALLQEIDLKRIANSLTDRDLQMLSNSLEGMRVE